MRGWAGRAVAVAVVGLACLSVASGEGVELVGGSAGGSGGKVRTGPATAHVVVKEMLPENRPVIAGVPTEVTFSIHNAGEETAYDLILEGNSWDSGSLLGEVADQVQRFKVLEGSPELTLASLGVGETHVHTLRVEPLVPGPYMHQETTLMYRPLKGAKQVMVRAAPMWMVDVLGAQNQSKFTVEYARVWATWVVLVCGVTVGAPFLLARRAHGAVARMLADAAAAKAPSAGRKRD